MTLGFVFASGQFTAGFFMGGLWALFAAMLFLIIPAGVFLIAWRIDGKMPLGVPPPSRYKPPPRP